MKKRLTTLALGGIMTMTATLATPAHAATDQARISELEKKMTQLLEALHQKQTSIDTLTKQVATLSAQNGGMQTTATAPSQDEKIKAVVEAVVKEHEAASPLSKVSFGGYGEIHANFAEGSSGSKSNDKFDIHRMVALVGYEFADWIKFQSEIELEHAFVEDTQSGDKAGGYLMLEQAYVDFLLSDQANVRVGRVLTPVGITNQHHEPTRFYSVERPNFDKYIIPTTWSSDGLGLFGNLTPNLSYEAYVVGGLDGSKFTSDGIRDGRIKDEPSLNDMAVTMRLDYYPFMESGATWGKDLRLGASLYHGGIDNRTKGADAGKGGDLTIYAADFSGRFGDLDMKGVVAFEEIDGAQNLSASKVAEELYGYFIEAGYHIMPAAWKSGKLANADLVPFV
ncbi:MAG TPA: porin, partial [Desulfurivibrionaceae bacterium]|nr:porin [Desulfurivibrionaceae bacterium]